MTLDEAVALLREAQPWIQRDSPVEATDLLMRIDAALAAHDAEPAEVEWALDNEGRQVVRIGSDRSAQVMRSELDTDKWWWAVIGIASDEDEAKAAVLKAARSAR